MSLTTGTLSGLSVTDRNTDIPFFPNQTWNLVSADFGMTNLPTFNYIQAFYDPSLTEVPQLALFTGSYSAPGVPILSLVRFAYSGERIQIKGSGIFLTGVNIRGQSISSTQIGSTPTTQLSQVIAYGGSR